MAGSDWAIVIGVNQYEFLPSNDHLKYAVNDAIKVRSFLCENAKFPAENVLLCCDDTLGLSPQHRPTRNGLRHLLKHEIRRAKGASNFWFFYAGHGIVHEHQDFLLPCDGNPSDLVETAIPISFVTDCLRDCGADNVVLVMDMCRNRTPDLEAGSRAISDTVGMQTQEIAKEHGIVTLFSCSRGEKSYEIVDLGQGVFTYALLEGLTKVTTPRALEQYLAQRVPTLNRQHGKNIQMPRVIPEPGFKYDRPLLLSCATSADIQQLAVDARDAELEAHDYELAKALWWQVIEAERSTQRDRSKARKAIDRLNHLIHSKSQPEGPGRLLIKVPESVNIKNYAYAEGKLDRPSSVISAARFTAVNLTPYANDSIDWLVKVPVGEQTFDGVDFNILEGPRAAVKSATVGRPTWPTRFSFPLGGEHVVQRVHAMLSGTWVDQEPTGIVGTLKIVYSDSSFQAVELIRGRTIQEGWSTERDLFAGTTPKPVEGVRWRTVYYDEQKRGDDKSFAMLDILSVDVDSQHAIDRIELERLSDRSGFALVALTLEH